MARRSYIRPRIVRSRVFLEIAAQLLGSGPLNLGQVNVLMRNPGDTEWKWSLSSDDSDAGIRAVSRGEVTLGITNPSCLLSVAMQGVPPFRGIAPLRSICVLPSPDVLIVAFRRSTGLQSLEDVRKARYPLRLSLRGQLDNSIHLVTDHVIRASGWCLADLVQWGGSIEYTEELPSRGDRIELARSGEIDALIDQAAVTWTDDALDADMEIVSLSPQAIATLEGWGYRGVVHPVPVPSGVHADVLTIDYSGNALYVREDAPADFVRGVCTAVLAGKDRLLLQTGEAVQIDQMLGSGVGAPLAVPLHDSAAAFWHENGYGVPT